MAVPPQVEVVLPGSAAEESGLMAGDEVVSVSKQDVTGLTHLEIVQLIRGVRGISSSLFVLFVCLFVCLSVCFLVSLLACLYNTTLLIKTCTVTNVCELSRMSGVGILISVCVCVCVCVCVHAQGAATGSIVLGLIRTIHTAGLS